MKLYKLLEELDGKGLLAVVKEMEEEEGGGDNSDKYFNVILSY